MILIGLFLLFYVVSDFIYWITIVIANKNLHSEEIGVMVATVAEFIFATSLVLGSDGWIRVIRKLRYGER